MIGCSKGSVNTVIFLQNVSKCKVGIFIVKSTDTNSMRSHARQANKIVIFTSYLGSLISFSPWKKNQMKLLPYALKEIAL